MTGNIQLDYSRMFRHGCAFLDCARNCEREPNSIECRFHSHTVAGIVNSAFACEVFIKALLVFHGMQRDELLRIKHDLDSLWKEFKNTDNETAKRVEESLKAWFDSDNDNMFDEMLEKCSHAFVHWRYIYEQQEGSVNINFLSGFRDILREVCCEKFYAQTWEDYKSN